MRFFYLRRANGEIAFSGYDPAIQINTMADALEPGQEIDDDDLPRLPYDPGLGTDWEVVQEMPRFLELNERWDEVTETIVPDFTYAESLIDAGHDVPAIHTRKAIEARTFKASGDATLAPLLAAEALDLSLDLDQLCDEVIAHDDLAIAAELERRRAKEEMRAAAQTGL